MAKCGDPTRQAGMPSMASHTSEETLVTQELARPDRGSPFLFQQKDQNRIDTSHSSSAGNRTMLGFAVVVFIRRV